MSKRIVIIGGVAAGASAATRARRMNENAQITIFERGAYISFANCGLPYHVGEVIPRRSSLLVATPELLDKRFNIDVRVRHEVTRIDTPVKRVRVKKLDSGEEFTREYDELIIATGAAPIVPPIEGVDAENVHVLRSMEDMDAIKAAVDSGAVRHATVIGAGYIGLEVAESLSGRGVAVDVVELADQVLTMFDADMACFAEREIQRHGVALHLSDGLASLEFAKGRVRSVITQSGCAIKTDCVLMAIGVKPDSALAGDAGLSLNERGGIAIDGRMQTSDSNVFAAGDAVEVVHAVTGERVMIPLAGPANRHGRLAGEVAATGKGATACKVAGTAIVKVFDLTAAATGLTEKAARAAGLDCGFSFVRRPHHAGYYPGAKSMCVKLVYQKSDGKILGVQVVGQKGVDRRIDVVAAVLHFGGTIDDLADLDLAYAPPYGSAKDPLHIAANVAQNGRAGLVHNVHPREVSKLIEAGALVLDVSTPTEFAARAIPGAINIPVDQLRARAKELDTSKRFLVYCEIGQRGYIAARILRQLGFQDVVNVAGGAFWYGQQGFVFG